MLVQSLRQTGTKLSKEILMKKTEVKDIDKSNIVYSWAVQGNEHIIIDHTERIYMWDVEGKRYIDFCAGLLNINIGHSNPYVLDAMKKTDG